MKKRCVFAHLFASTTLLFAAIIGVNFLATTHDALAAESTISLSVTSHTLSVDITPNRAAGVFGKSNSSTVSITTNNYTGYTFGISASSSGTNATNLVNGNEVLASIESAVSETDFGAEANTGYNNKWGYLPSKLNSAANTDFLPAPDANGSILDHTSSANDVANTYTLAVGARVDQTAVPGTYSNTFVLTVVANPSVYAITYDANAGSDMVTNMPTPNPLTGTSDNSAVNISSTVPARADYVFKGWCSVATSDHNCSGTVYNPNGGGTDLAVALSQTDNNVKSIYAMWKPESLGECDSEETCMQKVSTCPTTSTNLTDARDGKEYSVVELNDGNCWMTSNLRFTGTTLDPEFSNVESDTTITYGDLTDGDSYSEARIHEGVDGNNDPTVWYNYAAASAMTITGSSNGADAIYDICPKGWRLPTNNEIEGITDYVSTFNPVTGGYYFGGEFKSTGRAYWWAATPASSSSRNGLRFESGSLDPGYHNRTNGFYVRCIKETKKMQDVSSYDLRYLAPDHGDNVVLQDVRDSKSYQVTNIDGTYRMTENLRFTGTSLDPTTSNVGSVTTITYGDLTSGDSYDEARIHSGSDRSGKPTVWYNYAAASAATITGYSNMDYAAYDICPKGWRMPSVEEISSITSSSSVFSPVVGGRYVNGALENAYIGFWWSATASKINSAVRYNLFGYGDGSDLVVAENNVARYAGFYVRCVKAEPQMQDVSADDLRNIVPSRGDNAILQDKRDGKNYQVTNIDGNYWMTQNLRFTGTDLDPVTSNVESATTMTYGDLTSGNSYDEARIHTGTDGDGNPTVWYNFAAASATSITGISNEADATEDICPAGWRLPNNDEIGSITSYRSAFSPVYGGSYGDGQLVYSGNGYWWSSTASGAPYRHSLYWYSSGLGTDYFSRARGFYIRCIKDIPQMQETSAYDLSNMVPDHGDSVVLQDKRDGKNYQVTNIDGNYWMTQNLRFTGTNLDPSDSNVGEATTITYGDLTSGNSYDQARVHTGVDSNGSPTVWYNYAAASAMTVTGDSNDTGTIYDVCPKGWRLPNNSEISDIASGTTVFSPVAGGGYSNGTIYQGSSGYGYWWSSNTYVTTGRYLLGWYGTIFGQTYANRTAGYYIRCIKDVPKMQDVSASDLAEIVPNHGDNTVLQDSRDGKNYQVTNIDGNYWMTQNLRFTGTELDPSSSNVESATTITYGELASSSGNSYDEAKIHTGIDNKGDPTVWYNFAAASATTITGSSNGTDATSDICPKGWRLPNYDELSKITSYSSVFKPVTGGDYSGGTLYGPGNGYWWSSTASSTLRRYRLYWNGGSLGTNDNNRVTGFYIRCVKDITRMQELSVANLESIVPNSGDNTILQDRRDRKNYEITNINGVYWMTQNLRFTETSLHPSTSNVKEATTIVYGDLTSGGSLNEAKIHSGTDSNGKSTVWYNYAAASAMTITGDSNEGATTEDVCPAGWRMPTRSEAGSITSNTSDFKPVAGGYYNVVGSLSDTGSIGDWWAVDAYNTTDRYYLGWNNISLGANGHSRREYGFYIRCIKTNDGYLQDAELDDFVEGEQKLLADKRDGNTYTVKRINGSIWMTQNLRFTGTSLDPSTSNVESATTITYGDLSSGNSYDEARIHTGTDNNGDPTVWYNFAAASAMTITGSSNDTDAVYDVCPKGWRLPAENEFNGIISHATGFNPVAGGYGYNGSITTSGVGHWWSATRSGNSSGRARLGWNGNDLNLNFSNRTYGFYVRCIKANDGYLQDAQTSDFSEGEQKTLVDKRDGNVYTVKKINGMVWMTQNLRFTGTSLDPATSNVSEATTITYGDLTTGNSFNEARIHTGTDNNGDPTVWYNYAAASAMTITGSSNENDAAYDICPGGWRLPTQSETRSITSNADAFNPVAGGNYSTGVLSNADYGYWWSSIATDTTNRYGLGWYGSSLNASNYSRGYGFYIRCVKDEPQMQEVSATELGNLIPNSGDKTVLQDSRDGKNYQITNIDGNYWMTQNLRFSGTNLDPATSNVGSATTITYGDLASGNSYDQARIHSGTDNNGDLTVWYNYAAASAMTVTGGSNESDTTSDICPKGWRLPIQSEIDSIASYIGTFNPVVGGDYFEGGLSNPSSGYWWAATTYSTTSRYRSYWNGSSSGASYSGRGRGLYVRCIKDVPKMQDMSASVLADVVPNHGDNTVLQDSRDGKNYQVTNIDGNYWMTQNLRFTGTSLDPATSNVGEATTITYGDLTSGNSYDQARVHTGVDSNGNPTVWYNYAAASAMTMTGNSSDIDATYDICPVGWRLPTHSEVDNIKGVASYTDAFNPVAGGYYSAGSLLYPSYNGYWWSSTASSATSRFTLRWGGSSTLGTSEDYRNYGFYIRCIKDVTTMQDVSASDLAGIVPNHGDSTVLQDSRDGKNYQVTNIDGNYWMTQNLRFTGTSLDPTTSNVKTAKTISYGDLTSGDSYDEARIHAGVDDEGNPTVWYNFAAISAMTITGASNNTDAEEDICPKGWRLPTQTEISDVASYLSSFNPVAGGWYGSGILKTAGSGYWWSATAHGYVYRHYLVWDGYRLFLHNTGDGRTGAIYARCIKDIPQMQEVSISDLDEMIPDHGDSTVLQDSRDGKNYQVTNIDGMYWMTENLRFTGTDLDPSTSNVESSTTITYGDLTDGDSYDAARIHAGTDSNGGPTVWYNYAAASAMTITGSSNSSEAVDDVCPKGWRIPSNNEIDAVKSQISAFNPITGGIYDGGSLGYPNNGFWWSATSSSTGGRNRLGWNESSLYTGNDFRRSGLYIRCVKSS